MKASQLEEVYLNQAHQDNLTTVRAWATRPQEALILKIHGFKFAQKLHDFKNFSYNLKIHYFLS